MNSTYCGRALHIDLKNKGTWIEIIPEEVYDLLLGGKGLGIYFLLRIPPKTDPFAPENDFILVTGPLTGTMAPCANKWGLVTKGPASNGFLDAYSSGKIATKIKNAGYDVIIFHNHAEKMSVLKINNEKCEFLSAEQEGVVEKSPLETENILRKTHGSHFACASIGLAGERLSTLAGVFTEQRCAARGGGGAVLGAKKVKAILIAGDHPIQSAHPTRFQHSAWIARRYIRSGESTTRALPLEGTLNIADVVNERSGFPTRNFQSGYFKDIEKINGEKWRKEYWSPEVAESIQFGTVACAGCPISCSKISISKESATTSNLEPSERLAELNNRIIIDGPEYETLYALGSNLGNADQETIIQANYLCDFYGIDTISVGGVIACIMELCEKKIIVPSDLNGINPIWGDGKSILALIRKIGKMEGCGTILGRGSKAIINHWPIASDVALHVKGLELPGYDPRAARGMGLTYAISDRGACHLHAFTAAFELLGQGGGVDPLDLGPNKMELFLNAQADSNLSDCAILCFFTFNGLSSKEIRAMIEASTGSPHINDKEYLLQLSQRVLSLTRIFNLQAGLTIEDDMLPSRILNENQADHLKRPGISNFKTVLKDYYSAMGWNEEGKPKEETLEKLQITTLFPNIKEKLKDE